jgi:hypothetical protein
MQYIETVHVPVVQSSVTPATDGAREMNVSGRETSPAARAGEAKQSTNATVHRARFIGALLRRGSS